MKPSFAKPNPLLSDLVSCYWGWEFSAVSSEDEIRFPNVFPSVENEIHIPYADPIRIGFGSDEKWVLSRGHIVGNHLSPFRIAPVGNVGFFNVRLAPGAFYALFGIPAEAADSPVTELELPDNQEYYDFLNRIRGAESFEKRVAVSDSYLLDLRRRRNSADPLINEALRRIVSKKGRIRISELHGSLGIGKKNLERKFRLHVGYNPKEFARLVRFQNAAWMNAETRSLSDLSLEAGFYDQPHFTREFSALSGYSPAVWYEKRDSILSLFYNTRPASF
ncbi:helix-turn-helix domain-containing protein [Leptospira ellisii]|uniref:Helix-turn-helix domain-containing protein n=1 Tax=Leptospira ellisii TaxID=2023197 RepID=A0AAE4QMY0_9LEPT|nr:helix-turn-helix domain-containing protein [Leptospira ellisii]MDV6235515.1 helix-turn-helix domain-containing protein [Leptospira ellisii]